MHVAIVNRHRDMSLGGSEIQCDILARGLQARGHQITYVAPHTSAPGRALSSYAYEVMEVAPTARAIVDGIVSVSPDVVYWRFNLSEFLESSRELHGMDLPIVFAVSHIHDVKRWVLHRRGRRLAGAIRQCLHHARQFDGFRYVSALTVLRPDLLGRAPVQLQVPIANAMSAESVPFEWPRPYCAWIANIKSSKRPERAVELAGHLEDLGVDVLMIGYVQSERYRWLLDRTALPANCHYLGPKPVEEVNGVLRGCLLHVHTCRPEGFGNVFIQAWLQGRASVSLGFDPAGVIGRNGLGFDAGDDFERFTRLVQGLIEDPAARESIGRRAQSFARATFGEDRLVDEVEELLQGVLHGIA